MARCIKCGHVVQEDARFCPECGAEIIESVQTVPTELTSAEVIKEPASVNADADTEEQQTSSSESVTGEAETADNKETAEAVSPDDVYEPSDVCDSYKCCEGSSYSGMAIAGFVLSFFFPILGIIFSAIGMGQTKNAAMKGRGLAIAGLTISIVFCCLGCVFLLLGGLSMAMVAAF